MRLYFGRNGQFRGYSMGLGVYVAAGVLVLILVAVLIRDLVLLWPLIAVFTVLAVLVRPSLATPVTRPLTRAWKRIVSR